MDGVRAGAGAGQRLLTEVLSELRKRLPFTLLGLDTDNDSVFMNETVREYCIGAGVEFTRCRPYRKNDQAWVEQKNGAVGRGMVGYRRFEGLEAAALARLHASLRLFVNFFQPSFKFDAKARDGAKVRKGIIRPPRPFSVCWRTRASSPTRRSGHASFTLRWIQWHSCTKSVQPSSAWSRSPTSLWQMTPGRRRLRSNSSSRDCVQCGRGAR